VLFRSEGPAEKEENPESDYETYPNDDEKPYEGESTSGLEEEE
jgi:hypothetical protein